ncbi:MAG: DUF2231 domain-containing protein [bacterium]|nr:DUF2231 domain-containing protein [Acidimicrobiia bacterium]MCY4649407.1 DUF2231 domain-containing protein [bacterium]
MEKLANDTIENLHSILVHFPIALLVLLAALTAYVVLRPQSGMLQTTWLLLVVGTIGAIAATVSGLVSHAPYEETDLHGVIETHQMWSFGVTALFIVAITWRFISRRRGSDCGGSVSFLVLVVIGTGLLVMSGLTGGDLVFDYGVNVRGVNPLLDK